MRVRDRVLAFLMFRQSIDFCDACLSSHLGTSLEEARAAARELSRLSVFLRDRWTCHECGRQAAVTRALSNRTMSTRRGLDARFRRLGRVAPDAGRQADG